MALTALPIPDIDKAPSAFNASRHGVMTDFSARSRTSDNASRGIATEAGDQASTDHRPHQRCRRSDRQLAVADSTGGTATRTGRSPGLLRERRPRSWFDWSNEAGANRSTCHRERHPAVVPAPNWRTERRRTGRSQSRQPTSGTSGRSTHLGLLAARPIEVPGRCTQSHTFEIKSPGSWHGNASSGTSHPRYRPPGIGTGIVTHTWPYP